MAQIFISHVEKEKLLASAIERFLRTELGYEQTSVFLSSNIFSMAPGEQFEQRIQKEIAGCKVFLMMCSNTSFRSHWIHVEAGAAWVAGKPIVPVCYGGKTKGSLPRPYSSFHALNLDDAYDLVIAVANALKLPHPPPGPPRMTGSLGSPWPMESYKELYDSMSDLEGSQSHTRRAKKPR